MKMPEPTIPPITSIVASNNPRRAARVGRGSGCAMAVCASRDGVESAKKNAPAKFADAAQAGGANLSSLARQTKRSTTSLAPGRNEKAAHLRAALPAHLALQYFAAIFRPYCLS